jgi:twitching motility two-component system response regulator PilH
MAAPDAVVIADSDGEHRQRITKIVGAAGKALKKKLVVHQAADGDTAEELIDEVRPILIVMDVLLDGPSGLQLLRKLKAGEEEGEKRLWVFVSEMSHEHDKYWALRNGADAYVMRPYEDEALKSRLVKLLRKDVGDVTDALDP